MKKIIKSILFKIFCLLPIKKNKVVCANFYVKAYGDNPKYIVDELLKQNGDYDIVWVCQAKYNDTVPKEVRIVNGGIRLLYEYATAKVWISNVRMPLYFTKRKKQFYLQTWHGGLGLKKCEKEVMHTLSKEYLKTIDKDSQMIDLAVSNSKFLDGVYDRAMDYHGKLIRYGLPRNDNLVKQVTDYRHLKKELGIVTSKVLLYAPTFRDDSRLSAYNLDVDKLLVTLNKQTKEKWTILVKFHPNVSDTDKIIKFNKEVINVSDYGDINALFNICDALITDYSSCMFDYMLLKRNIFLYTPDIDLFMQERNFMIDIYSLPFPIAKNNEELLTNIEKYIGNSNLIDKYDPFNRKYGLNETGESAYQIAKVIEKVIKGEKYEV